MCAIQVRVLHNAHIHVLHTSVRRVHHWYKLQNLWATDAMCPVHHWCNIRTSCATHVRVLIHATSVCYTGPCVMYTAYTSNPRPTSSVCWSACEPLIPATSPSVVFTTVTSYTRPRNFLVHFFYYIRDLHILHASFSTCASDLNKTDGLRELARDWQRF